MFTLRCTQRLLTRLRSIQVEEAGSGWCSGMDVTVTVTVPEGALSALRQGPLEFAEELKRAAVAKWYELGVVSQSKGAELLGISRSEFLDFFRSTASPHTKWTMLELAASP